MGVWRRWILPITRLVVLGAIAVALVRMAFFGTTAEDTAETPTGSVVQSQVASSVATVVNDVTVKGAIQPDPDVPVKATLQGKVAKLVAGQGATVQAGDPILVIRQETPVDPVVAADGTVTQPKPKVVTETVTASAAGSLVELGVLVGQEVAVGDAVGRIAPPPSARPRRSPRRSSTGSSRSRRRRPSPSPRGPRRSRAATCGSGSRPPRAGPARPGPRATPGRPRAPGRRPRARRSRAPSPRARASSRASRPRSRSPRARRPTC
ncbi:hypothetical protein [Clavibacter tessellarius]|uniref:hypothetical protein n=1 Tax=Clavibacter tessellarius TaxID=31965 RepID=UPI003249F6AE